MNHETFERDLWKLAEAADHVRSNAPLDLTADEMIELLAVARRLENLVFHRQARAVA